MPMKVQQKAGNVGKFKDGKAWQEADTSVGKVVRFSLGTTLSYPDMGQDNGETRWLSVAVFKPSIQQQVKDKITVGARVVVEGVITQSEYQGVAQYGMKASRVGLIDWFMPSAEDKAAGAARAAAAAPATESDEGDW
jgi:single-stranded DNA-binding protein